jgi:GT2 family glycosyltransferase
MTPPTFSVIITTYNRPSQLRHCLTAITRVHYARDAFEVVVVDDGGREALDGLIAEFRDALALTLVTQANAGPASGRNHGARLARHEFLAFTDDDCEPDPGWLLALSGRLGASPDILVGGRTCNGLPDNPYSSASQLIVDMVYAFYNADPTNARFLATNNLAVRASLFRDVGGLDEHFRVSEDREFCDRWRHRGFTLVYEPRAIVFHRHHLTLSSFWRQHVQYGRGAARFHRASRARHSGRLHDHIGFHLNLPRWWYRVQQGGQYRHGPIRLLPPLALWQIANAGGFLWERLIAERGERRARHSDVQCV